MPLRQNVHIMKASVHFSTVLLLAACSSIQTSYDYAKETDFSQYKTYGFTEGSQKFSNNELLRNRLLSAIDHELQARGYTQSDAPDLLVDLHATLEQKRTATATTSGMGGYYGGGWRYGYGGGFTTTHVDVNDYTEGTLFVNLVDRQTDKLVWQGRGTKTLDEHASAARRDANVNNAIQRIFSHYPIKPMSSK